jgi:transposase
MKKLFVPSLTEEQILELEQLYRKTEVPRVRTRAQMVLLSAEKKLTADEIADIVWESSVTVLRWLHRYIAEGIQGLLDAPRSGRNSILTNEFRKRLLEVVRRRPRSLELEFSMWTLQRLADFMAEDTGIRVSTETIRRALAKEDTRDHLKPDEVFYYADEFNVSWLPTLRAMWSPIGQQVMIPTPGQPKVHYGLGAVNYHSGESVVIIRRRKRRLEVAELLQTLVDKHSTGTIYVAWDNASTHQDDEVEAVVRAAAGRLVLLYLPTYSPWLNPIEMLWRHFRREVTHCEIFETVKLLIEASYNFFNRYNTNPEDVLSIIGALPS